MKSREIARVAVLAFITSVVLLKVSELMIY